MNEKKLIINMMKDYEQEINYLINLYDNINYDSNRFKIHYGNDKFVFGIISQNENDCTSKIMQYRSLYDTLIDLNLKTKISFDEALKFSYSENVFKNFNILSKSEEFETLAYYYIENAIFRISSLWDILAQFYRIHYNLEIDIDKLYYNKLFNPNNNINEKFKDKTIEIYEYLNEENDTKSEGEWKGNHKYLNKCRNKMTHRNSPNITTLSNYDINIKDFPAFMLKRIIEDYSKVSHFLSEVLDLIEETLIKELECE